MVARVIWTLSAQTDRRSILAYWKQRNGNATYSLKLLTRFRTAANRIRRHPQAGRPSDIPGIRRFAIGDYLMFYEVLPEVIVIHHLWDARRDLPSLEF